MSSLPSSMSIRPFRGEKKKVDDREKVKDLKIPDYQSSLPETRGSCCDISSDCGTFIFRIANITSYGSGNGKYTKRNDPAPKSGESIDATKPWQRQCRICTSIQPS